MKRILRDGMFVMTISTDVLALTLPFQSTETTDGFKSGLYVAKRIRKAHQGNLDIPSGGGDATTFLVHLPKTSGADVEPASAEATEQHAT